MRKSGQLKARGLAAKFYAMLNVYSKADTVSRHRILSYVQ